jgi:hypothetical protein
MKLNFSRALFLAAAVLAASVLAGAQSPQINDKPLRDFGEQVRSRIEQKQLDITKPFAVEMSAVITDDGKLDKNASKFTSESGDPKMIDVAKQAIMAMGESGYFAYLQQAGISQATIDVSQNAQTFTGSVHSVKNRFEATMMTAGINGILSVARTQNNLDANEKLIVENTRASHDAGNMDITCTLPASEFQRMILGKVAASGPSQ